MCQIKLGWKEYVVAKYKEFWKEVSTKFYAYPKVLI